MSASKIETRSEPAVKVPDFTISVYGKSSHSLFGHNVVAFFYEAGCDTNKRDNYMNCRTHKLYVMGQCH